MKVAGFKNIFTGNCGQMDSEEHYVSENSGRSRIKFRMSLREGYKMLLIKIEAVVYFIVLVQNIQWSLETKMRIELNVGTKC
jgi:hypothetical protein